MTARLDWLRARASGLGGSDVARILFGSAWDVWTSKTTPDGLDGEDRQDPEILRGRRLEPAVLDWMAEDARMPRRRLAPYTMIQGPEPWAFCTPDDLYDVPWVHGMEAKTDRIADKWGRQNDANGVPADKAVQCHWCMHCADADAWDIGVYLPMADDWRRWTLKRDAAVERALVEHMGAWWQRHVVDGAHPTMDGSKAARSWLVERFGTPEGTRAATDAEAQLVRNHVATKHSIGLLEVERDRVGNLIRESMGSAEAIYFRGGRATWKAKGQTRELRTTFKES